MGPIRLITDQAIAERNNARTDALGFSSYADVISRIVRGTRGPFTIGVFGEWGMGKTSLMRMVEQRVQSLTDKGHTIVPVWFNAWMFEKADYPVVPLIKSVIEVLNGRLDIVQRGAGTGKRLVDALEVLAAAFNLKGRAGLPGHTAELEVEVNPGGFLNAMRERRNARQYGVAQNDAYENIFRALHDIGDNVVPHDITIMVLIDDLDRCFPENAVRLLEAVKLVLAQPGFIFVLGASRVVIEEYLESKYRKQYGIAHYNGKAYLDKMIQLSFDIPPHAKRMDAFTRHIINSLDDKQTARDLEPVASVIGSVCQYNPRTVIRFINRLITDSAIYRQNNVDSGRLPVGVFAVTRSLQSNWQDFYGLLVGDDQTEDREYCGIVAAWKIDDLSFWRQHDPSAQAAGTKYDLRVASLKKAAPETLKQIASLLAADRTLRTLMEGRLGREWLTKHEQRETSISFLSAQSAVKTPPPAPVQGYVAALEHMRSTIPQQPKQVYTAIGDDMYRDALEVVIKNGKASTSLLQRNLQIGFGVAAQLLMRMQTAGVIGPTNSTEPQQVLVSSIAEALDRSAARSFQVPTALPPHPTGSYSDYDSGYFFPLGQ